MQLRNGQIPEYREVVNPALKCDRGLFGSYCCSSAPSQKRSTSQQVTRFVVEIRKFTEQRNLSDRPTDGLGAKLPRSRK